MTPLPLRSPKWLGLGVLLLAVLLVAMDVTILYFAAPYISADLAPSGTQQLWMLDVYGFVLAGLLITMGALADRSGGGGCWSSAPPRSAWRAPPPRSRRTPTS